MLKSQVILELSLVKLMETTVLKAKTVTCIGFDVQISILFDMQIHFYFPDYTAPPQFESRVTKLFKLMKTTE